MIAARMPDFERDRDLSITFILVWHAIALLNANKR
jgi:hypothetical protein